MEDSIMTKKVLSLIFVIVLVVLSFAACKGNNDDDGGNNGGFNVIYKKNSEIRIVLADGSNAASEKAGELNRVLLNLGVNSALSTLDKERSKNEIIIGKCDLDISKKAYAALEHIDNEDPDYALFTVYSDGNSIAIAYDHEAAMEAAIDTLINKYFTEDNLSLTAAVYEKEKISILDYYAAVDEANREREFDDLEAKIGPEYGPEIVKALKDYYATLNPDVVTWFANLYDPDIGGYYFSNSGRNTPGYLPDLESTQQALGFFENMGVYAKNVISDEMKQKMGQFAYNMQDENGFFYHPQWTKELTDSKLSRRARDLGHGASLLSLAGLTPKYPLATDQIESVDPTSVESLPGRLGQSAVVAVSKVVATADVPHLKDEETFLNYLRGLGVYNNSYGPGNQVSAQWSQIAAAGLADTCVDYFESIQNPKNGLWEDEVSYKAIDGLLKISGMWANVGRVFPYAKEAIQSVIEMIMCEEDSGCVVEMYNCWFSIRNIINSMTYAGLDGADFVAETRNTLLALAPEAIRLTQKKVAVCQKPDGSFSWSAKYSSSTSQGCPVAVPNTIEGDVNATVIGYSGTISNIMHALGYSKIPPLGKRELHIYLTTLNSLGTIVKDDTINIGEPFDFEGAAVDSTPGDFKINVGEGSSALVAIDPVDEKNKVLHLVSKGKVGSVSGNGDTLYIPNTVGMDGSCMVFTGDFYVSSNTTKGYFMQITMDKCYLFTLQSDSNGRLRVIDANSTTSSNTIYNTYDVVLDFDQWFNVKIEYYVGDRDTVRIKAYVNGTLVCISDNYWNQDGKKFTENVAPGTNAVETRLYCMMDYGVDMYLDNLHTYKLNKTYQPEKIDSPTTPNVDSPDKDERVYNFDSEYSKDVVTSLNLDVSDRDRITIFDGEYTFGNGNKATYSAAGVSQSEFNGSKSMIIDTSGAAAKLQIPTTVRTSTANCGTLGFDVQVLEAAVGDFATVKFYDKNGSANSSSVIMGITLSCIEEGDNKYVVMKEMPGGTVSAQLDGVKIPIGDIVNMRFEFFHAEDATLIFINDVSAAASYSIFDGGHKYTMGYASIETSAKVASKIQIDNLKCERIVRDYTAATAPNVDRDVYKFNDKKGIETTGSVNVTTVGGDKVLTIGADSTVKLPVNHRSPVVNITTFETLINFSVVSPGSKFYVKLVDENGNTVLGYAFLSDGSSIKMHELTKHGITMNVLTSLLKETAYTLKVEYCPSRRTANVYLNGTAAYVTNVNYDDETLNNKMMNLVFESESANAYIDNTYVEAVNTVFTQCKPENKDGNKEDNASILTFESSSATNLPKKVEKSFKSSGAALRIRSMLRGDTLTNTLSLTTSNGNCDTLRFKNMTTVPNSNCASFEADIMFDGFKFKENITQFNVGEVFLFTIGANESGEVTLGAMTATGGSGRVWGTAVNLGKQNRWVHLRIDVFPGDASSVLAKVYVDNELVLVTNKYKGYRTTDDSLATPSSNVADAHFYTYVAGDGTIHLDNVSYGQLVIPIGSDPITDDRNK